MTVSRKERRVIEKFFPHLMDGLNIYNTDKRSEEVPIGYKLCAMKNECINVNKHAPYLPESEFIKSDPGYCRSCRQFYQGVWCKSKLANEEAEKLRLTHDLKVVDCFRIMKWFNDKCAYCGKIIDRGNVSSFSFDHIVPLSSSKSKNPGTTIRNLVLCCSGKGGCNSRKGSRNMEQWVKTSFSSQRADIILKSINKYQRSI